MKRILVCLICALCFTGTLSCSVEKADHVVVKKTDRKMMLYAKDKLLKMYKISLGGNPIGHKMQEGDSKTPEGSYKLSHKNGASRFHKSFKISYPNNVDRKDAKKRHVSPGGDVMIHGLGKEFSYLGKMHILHDWTLGCIAVTNEEIDEIWGMVDAGTSIQIDP